MLHCYNWIFILSDAWNNRFHYNFYKIYKNIKLISKNSVYSNVRRMLLGRIKILKYKNI